MTRYLAVVSLITVVSVAPACVTKATDPTPVATPTPGPPQGWTGTFTQKSSTVDARYPDYPPYVVIITGTVTWQTNATPPEHSLPNATHYAVSGGEMAVTYSGGPCAYEGQGHFTLGPWQPDASSGKNTLDVRPDGYYGGWLDQEVEFPGTQSNCPGRREVDLGAFLGMVFSGNLASGRVQGTTVEQEQRTTWTYSWDFGPRY